jgi:hypothetical protein
LGLSSEISRIHFWSHKITTTKNIHRNIIINKLIEQGQFFNPGLSFLSRNDYTTKSYFKQSKMCACKFSENGRNRCCLLYTQTNNFGTLLLQCQITTDHYFLHLSSFSPPPLHAYPYLPSLSISIKLPRLKAICCHNREKDIEV